MRAREPASQRARQPALVVRARPHLTLFVSHRTHCPGFHYDLNFLTIHGKSRFPGLYVWRRDGHRVPVRVPDGCLLVQAGKELEWLTGGVVEAGFHEVVVDASTLAALERQRARSRPLWRISSTVFCHINSDQILRPLGPFDTPEARAKYPPTVAGDYVISELETIQLKKA